MVKRYEKLYLADLATWEHAFALLCRYNRTHIVSGKIFWITDEYACLSDKEYTAREELDEARAKFFAAI